MFSTAFNEEECDDTVLYAVRSKLKIEDIKEANKALQVKQQWNRAEHNYESVTQKHQCITIKQICI